MKLKTVTVSAGRTFNHPYENYSNFKHHVELTADLEDVDGDGRAAVKHLQARAEAMAEEHKQHLLGSVRELRELQEYQQEIASLETTIKGAQERLEKARAAMVLTPALGDGAEATN